MAVLSTLVKTIAEVEGLEEVQVGWVARYLREAGLISSGGRGKGGAAMTKSDAANILIGVNAAASPKEAAHIVGIYRELRISSDLGLISSRNGPLQRLAEAEVNFGQFLEELLLIASSEVGPSDNFGKAMCDSLPFPQNSTRKDVLISNIDERLTYYIRFTRPRVLVEAYAVVSGSTYGRIVFSPEVEKFAGDRIETVAFTQATLRAVGLILTS